MTDEKLQKRVLPARERRESAAKRQASSPVVVSTPTPKKTVTQTPTQNSEPRQKRKYVRRAGITQNTTKANADTPPATDEVLPTRLNSSRSLPTTREKQPAKLSEREYQSIAESAILAASLYRSRMQWLCDGIFQKYWTKPVKRKGVTEVPSDNPDQKSMHKLGNAVLTIEPHAFDVIFYTVRDPLQPLPYYRHPNQHTPKAALPPPPPLPIGMHYPPPSYAPSQAPSPAPPTQTSATQSPAPPKNKESSPGVMVKSEHSGSAALNDLTGTSSPSPNPTSMPQPESKPAPTPTAPSTPSVNIPKSNTDPVIQMLAARAASDPRLKELMKVVATSKASPEQLKEFQSHIDEFNAVVRRQETERASQEKQSNKTSTVSVAATSAQAPAKSASPVVQASPGAAHPAMYNPSLSRPGMLPSGGGPVSMPPYLGFTPPVRPEPIIKHIVVEFTGNVSSAQSASPDRWLFPEYAVLDIRYGGLEMICSFFVERKGADIISVLKEGSTEEPTAWHGKWKADQDYYQPVTLTIKANQHRTIESIARAAKPLAAVQEHMQNVMKTKTRAPEEYLVHQLPRDKVLEFADSGVEMDSGSEERDEELKEWYGNV